MTVIGAIMLRVTYKYCTHNVRLLRPSARDLQPVRFEEKACRQLV